MDEQIINGKTDRFYILYTILLNQDHLFVRNLFQPFHHRSKTAIEASGKQQALGIGQLDQFLCFFQILTDGLVHIDRNAALQQLADDFRMGNGSYVHKGSLDSAVQPFLHRSVQMLKAEFFPYSFQRLPIP
ncbi:hypothetical protein SDC9_186491 [bioreactor metagenome]|uniref:Uncharacterized protein n=1 Tax=bioreactor metagenome TaxID=1076179 RepID=A0A645HK37_9ZZZZ